jgi:hypothetical protein
MIHSVLKRQNDTVASDSGRDRLHGAVKVVGFASEQHNIVMTVDFAGQYRPDRAFDVAAGRPDDKPSFSQLSRPLGPDQETQIGTTSQQHPAEISANGAGAENQVAHFLILHHGLLAEAGSPAARRNPDSNRSRCSEFRR